MKGLDSRYQALLQMYGEKVEEAEECMLDLQDVKDMYKSQVSHLQLLPKSGGVFFLNEVQLFTGIDKVLKFASNTTVLGL